MKLFCANQSCDFEFEDIPTNAALQFCPKCGGSWFQSPKGGTAFYGRGTVTCNNTANFTVPTNFTALNLTAANTFPFSFTTNTITNGTSESNH